MTEQFLNRVTGRVESWAEKVRCHLILGICFLITSTSAFSQPAGFVSYIADTHLGYSITCSPDGKNVYAGGAFTLVAFAHNADHSLTTLQVLNNDVADIRGIHNIIDLAVTPDGRFLYAVEIINQSLLLFSRDTSTGEITLVESFRDSAFTSFYQTIPFVEYNYELLISADGSHLYWLYSPASNYSDNVIAVFARDKQSGSIRKIQALKNGDANLGGFKVPSSLAISPDGRFLYGAGYNGYKVLVMARDQLTGQISFEKVYDTDSTRVGSWLASTILVSPDGTSVYATNFGSSRLLVFTRNTEDGNLSLLDKISQPGPRAILMSNSGSHVYLGRNGDIAAFTRETESGQLNLTQVIDGSFTTAASLTLCPIDLSILLSSENAVTIFGVDSIFGELTLSNKVSNHFGGTDRLHVSRSVEVSPDGEFVYVGAQGDDAGINIFGRNSHDGRLTLTEFYPLPNARVMVMSPDGEHLYVTKNEKTPFEAFARDRRTGGLRQLPTMPNDGSGAGRDFSMTFTPDGLHLYVTTDTELTVYRRDPGSGVLERLQKINGRDYNSYRMQALAVAPDGAHAYWSGSHPNPVYDHISIFSRDSNTGQMIFADELNLDPLSAATAMHVSPDGRHLYAATIDRDADFDGEPVISVFERDRISGVLRPIQNLTLPGWCEIRDLTFTPDGQILYALATCTGYSSGMVAFLERDSTSGRLSLKEQFESWTNGVYGMFDPFELALAPDQTHLYVADLGGVATFATGRSNTTAVAGNPVDQALPTTPSLSQNYPNPFNPVTVITLDLPKATHVALIIYDVLGRRVRTLIDEPMEAGYHARIWDGHNHQGVSVASGVYFYRLHTPEFDKVRKMLVVR
ncbi:T9SS C-terminal target domain-containing protein [candidate division KSB1 bacterium]|nr:MAG: T9SS C-terminal target domain-containing protein [candidate division KSB1 bacterium]MBC6948784.1 T9SS C-terminal target domain-containing protein [candidate division KSB1 bacterium]MCE7941561.1 T9SS C-terminal target domain-containing protein [Chlorobi bacterium CHB1]MDL1875517.1 T9SS type A sorting domain-containing protein [Cytophagia bacterium CHB2]